MIKVVALLRRREGLSHEEFESHWRDVHPHYVRALPGVRRYVQSPAVDLPRKQWPYDGLAELWFDDVAAVRAAFASAAADPMREDEGRFLESIDWFLAGELVILDTTSPSGTNGTAAN
ncbi:MAG: EthD family reductase [Chloroflexi bacterium]|nr:EthD family reductase [Chloroflexota bacterium]